MNNRIKLVACLLAAVATGALFAQQPPVSDTVTNPLATSATAAADGQRIFDGTCQTCHGAAGIGDPGRGGPALNVTGLKQGDGDADLFRTIRQGVSGTQMPPYKGLRDEQVWQLVSYIRSLQNTAASTGPSRGAVAPEGNVAAGEALFFGRAGCASCHEINARGGVTGPDLSNAGRLTAAALRQKIVVAQRAVAARAGRPGRRWWPRRCATGDAGRQDGRRPRDSWRATKRRHVFGAGRRRIRAAAPDRQTEDARHGRSAVADAE